MTTILTSIGDVHLHLTGSWVPKIHNELPILGRTLSALQLHNPRLRKLSIDTYIPESSDEWQNYVENKEEITLQLGGFRDLKSLTVLELHGPPAKNLEGLISTLSNSPFLESFALKIRLCVDPQLTYFTLLNLCQSYASSGAQPLSLKSLCLDEFGLLYANSRSATRKEMDYLPLLTDLKKLEHFSILNSKANSLIGRHPGIPRWAYDTLYEPFSHASQFHSLRRLSAQVLDKRIATIVCIAGSDNDVPPSFLSELFFDAVESKAILRIALNIDRKKRDYWPRAFFLRDISAYDIRKEASRALCTWKGLERLHLTLDITRSRERVSRPSNP